MHRRQFLAGAPTATVGGLAGCLSALGSDSRRSISLAFIRLVNTTFDHERTLDLTVLHNGDAVLDQSYEGVPPSRSPRAIVKATGPYIGFLPGETESVDETFSGPGTDTESWPRQLPEAHTIPLDGRRTFDEQHHPSRYDVEIEARPPEISESFELSEAFEQFEQRIRSVEDDSRVGLVIEFGTDLTRSLYPKLAFYAYETGPEQSLLEEYLQAEQQRQEHREEFGAQSVADSPFA